MTSLNRQSRSLNNGNRRRTLSVCLLLLFAMPAAAAPGDDERVSELLAKLGLVDLQTLHLEQMIDRTTDPKVRVTLAEQLADLYAGQLVNSSSDKSLYAAVSKRIERLIAKVPEAKTASLEVMLLQADYFRAEALVGKWLEDASDTESRDEAQAILAKIAPELDTHLKTLTEKREQLFDEMADMEGSRLARAEKEVARVSIVAARANYFAAWSHYYLGLAADQNASYQRAREVFRQLLDTGEDYSGVDPEFLNLASVWASRALIGLALTEAALGEQTRSGQCFKWLESPSVPPEIREQVPYWRLRALLNMRRYNEALTYGQSVVNEFGPAATQGHVSFCVTLIRAAYGSESDRPGNYSQLGMLGLGGLLKMQRRSTARQLMEQYSIELTDDASFYLIWLHGQQQFEEAEKEKSADGFNAAAELLTRALARPEAKDDLAAAAQCRSSLGWCQYRLGQLEQAAKTFEEAYPGLKASGNRQAVEIAWMAFVAYQGLSKEQPQFRTTAINVLNTIKRDFPTHERAKRADYFISKLREGTSTKRTMAALERVQKDSPDYLAARYDICAQLHDAWRNADAGEKASAAGKVYEAVDVYLDAADDQLRKTKCCLLAVSVAVGGKDDAQAKKYLDQARRWGGSLPAGNAVASEYHYRAMQAAKQLGNQSDQRRHADWIAKNGQGSPYELPALVTAARSADESVAASSNSAAAVQSAHKTYARLVALLGDTPDAIRGNRNAQVANSKLAHYAYLGGNHADAARRLDALLAATPEGGAKDRGYVRRAGLAHFKAGNYQASIEHWRVLLRGVKKGSDDWLEAKYHQVKCLLEIDPAKAKQTLSQFRLLYPNVSSPAWRDKFKAL